MKKRKKRRWILACSVLVFLIAAMIFLFSAQNAEESEKTSTGVIIFIVKNFYPGYESLTPVQKHALHDNLQLVIRKLGHFLEFALLGAALRLLFHLLQLRLPLLWAWLAGTLYAVSDEVHQMFVDSRGPTVTDVLIDSAGVLTLACLVSLILLIRQKAKQKNDPNYA